MMRYCFAIAAVLLPIAAGAQAPRVQTLDGDDLVLSNVDERKATAFVFISPRCEFTDGMIGTIESIHERFRFRDMLVVGICPNEAETGADLRRYLQTRGVRFPVYRDAYGEARAVYAPTATPEAVLVDRSGSVVYRGAIERGGESYLADAMRAMQRDKAIDITETSPEGTPIGEADASLPMDDPYGTIRFSSELVFDRAGDAVAHHCSSIAETVNGDLVCVWYGGSYESADDQSIYLARQAAGTRAWSEPESIIRNSIQPPGNAVVFRGPRDRLWIVWGRMEQSRPLRRGGGWGMCRLMYIVSEDDVRTWTKPEVLPVGDRYALPRSAPLHLGASKLLLPVTGTGRNDVRGAMAIIYDASSDSWEVSDAVSGGTQPSVVPMPDGRLAAYLRSSPFVKRMQSADGGMTWTPPEATDLQCPGSSVAALRLQSGALIIVHNDSRNSRSPLSLRMSDDDGATWSGPMHLESNPGEYSYPYLIQTRDGLIHLTYTFRRFTIKHSAFNETWIRNTDRPN